MFLRIQANFFAGRCCLTARRGGGHVAGQGSGRYHGDMFNADPLSFIVALATGMGLAAASGFRVFVPMLGMGLALRAGYVQAGPEWAWLAEPVTLMVLVVAAVAEVGAYFIPWLDNALDALATPAAVIAGTVLTALTLGDAPAILQWALAIVAGGGTAGVVQAGSVLTRAASLGTTGGLGNPVVALGEILLAATFTILSLVVPFVALAVLVGAVVWWLRRRRKGR